MAKYVRATTLDIQICDMYHLPIVCVTLYGKVCKGNNSGYKSMLHVLFPHIVCYTVWQNMQGKQLWS